MIAIYNLTITVCDDLNIILLIAIVVMIAACFLGRNVVISKKLLMAGAGVVAISVIGKMMAAPLVKMIRPDIYAGLIANPADAEWQAQYAQFAAAGDTIFGLIVYAFIFVFFLLTYQEKRVIRAIESFICFVFLYLFVSQIIFFEYLYCTGGRWKVWVSYQQRVGDPYHAWVFWKAVAGLVFNAIIAAILYFGFYRKKVCYRIKLRYRILFIAWLILFFSMPQIPFVNEVDDLMDRYQYLCYDMGFFIPLVGVVAPIMLVMGASAKALKEKNEAQSRYLVAELEYIERYKQAQTQTRAFRHDVVNNLTLATMLLKEGKAQEANAHLEEMLGKVQTLSPKYVTGDEMLDCIVSMKAEKMHDKGIEFTADGVVDGGLRMKPMDTCSIFANALDNAIEAASQTQQPKVSMNIKRTEKFFVISIENSAPQKVELEKLFSGEGYTTKKDKEFHGFGLRNIQQTVEANEGILQAKSGENLFALSIMIPRTLAS